MGHGSGLRRRKNNLVQIVPAWLTKTEGFGSFPVFPLYLLDALTQLSHIFSNLPISPNNHEDMTCPATRMKIGLNREACLRNVINLIISRLRRVDAPEALHHATHVLHLPELLCSKNACNQLSDGVWRRSFQLQHFTQQAAGGKTPDSQTLNLLQSQLASDCILREAKPFKRIGCAPRMNARHTATSRRCQNCAFIIFILACAYTFGASYWVYPACAVSAL